MGPLRVAELGLDGAGDAGEVVEAPCRNQLPPLRREERIGFELSRTLEPLCRGVGADIEQLGIEPDDMGVIKIDADKRRIGLSLKRVASSAYADADWDQVAAAIPDLDDANGDS